jgi:NitT/TauT family transport system permease protein
MATDTDLVPSTLRAMSGMDVLELPVPSGAPSKGGKLWSNTWPKLLALAIALAIWQIVVWVKWRPDYLLPGPAPVFSELGHQATTGHFWHAVGTTMRRALVGFALATAVGLLIGLAVARSRILRAAIGSMITALQTMPSIAWFPLAILLYQLTENAILFVIVLGAAPSIANGVIAGVDYVPPILLRAGQNIGARGIALYRHVIAPASLPSIVAGLKQGWAFAWRSLMAGELLVIIANRPSLGVELSFARENSAAPEMLADMIVILVLGLAVDIAFNAVDRRIRARWGLLDQANS